MVSTQAVTALSLLSMEPSPAVARHARAAAGSKHGLVNLTRLVHSLDQHGEGHDDTGAPWLDVQKTWETVLYARALLYALRGANEQSSTTALTLNELENVLSRVEVEVQATARRTTAPAPPLSLPLLDLPAVPTIDSPSASPAALLDENVPATVSLDDAGAALPQITSPPLFRAPSSSPLVAPKIPSPLVSPMLPMSQGPVLDTAEYFAKRKREDEAGGEAGLLQLKVAKRVNDDPMGQEGMRNRLLAGGANAAIGSSQLHEELGGQLANMSHRLKLNAMHFANSMEEEKALLQASQDVLEQNLSTTKESKGHLSQVSSKSRSTTCMTIGIVVLVMVLFIWTYMLIRIT